VKVASWKLEFPDFHLQLSSDATSEMLFLTTPTQRPSNDDIPFGQGGPGVDFMKLFRSEFTDKI
jgi:hypothetical protein